MRVRSGLGILVVVAAACVSGCGGGSTAPPPLNTGVPTSFTTSVPVPTAGGDVVVALGGATVTFTFPAGAPADDVMTVTATSVTPAPSSVRRSPKNRVHDPNGVVVDYLAWTFTQTTPGFIGVRNSVFGPVGAQWYVEYEDVSKFQEQTNNPGVEIAAYSGVASGGVFGIALTYGYPSSHPFPASSRSRDTARFTTTYRRR